MMGKPTDPLEEAKEDLFRQLRRIARDYGGSGEAFEETEMSLMRNPDASRLYRKLRDLGVSGREITRQAFRDDK